MKSYNIWHTGTATGYTLNVIQACLFYLQQKYPGIVFIGDKVDNKASIIAEMDKEKSENMLNSYWVTNIQDVAMAFMAGGGEWDGK